MACVKNNASCSGQLRILAVDPSNLHTITPMCEYHEKEVSKSSPEVEREKEKRRYMEDIDLEFPLEAYQYYYDHLLDYYGADYIDFEGWDDCNAEVYEDREGEVCEGWDGRSGTCDCGKQTVVWVWSNGRVQAVGSSILKNFDPMCFYKYW